MLRRAAGLLFLLLVVGLCWRGRGPESLVEVRLRGRLQLGRAGGPPGVELWLPRPRIFIDRRGQFYHRDLNGTLVAWRDPQNSCRVRMWRGELRITLKMRCSPAPDSCTVAVHQAGYVTRYAREVRLGGNFGRLSSELPNLGRPLRRLESKEELFNLVRKARGK
jgi:hypothetical protein